MRFVFSLFYKKLEKNFGYYDGGTSYGHRLLAPIMDLRNKLEQAGHEVLTSQECSLNDAGVVVFWDLDEINYKKALSLPKDVPCILISNESPIYSPLSHRSHILFSKRWSAVLTWNRAYSSNHIYHYDIPFVGEASLQKDHVHSKKSKGVVVSSYKKDPRGLAYKRDLLFRRMARDGFLDVYGANWIEDTQYGILGTSHNKIQTMRDYDFAFISENSIYPGYVTEKLADAIIAGIPSIYYGDYVTATRRFPGTFVRLEELTSNSFLQSRDILYRDYQFLMDCVKKSQSESVTWSSSFINTFLLLLKDLDLR